MRKEHEPLTVNRLLCRRGSVSADMLVNVLCFTVIVLFMILYWIFATPDTIQSAYFSGDVIDLDAEQFAAMLYKTPTVDGTFIDSLKKYIIESELRGENYAGKVLFRKFLPGNPLRYHKSDWIITIVENKTKPKDGILVAKKDKEFLTGEIFYTSPDSYTIENPYYEVWATRYEAVLASRQAPPQPEKIRSKKDKYFDTSMPLIIYQNGKNYTLIVYYIKGQFIDSEDFKGTLTYELPSALKRLDCTKIKSCNDYQKVENSCNEDTCYISFTACTFKSDEERCVER